MIDLHSHTNHSDGSCSPAELLRQAAKCGLETLAITDHDTLSGYDAASTLPEADGIELIRGIEITCKHEWENIHLLGYFFHADPGPEFREWLHKAHEHRRDRNRRLVARLNDMGIGISLEEAEAAGRIMTGRPHFAAVLVAKGYATSRQDAFDRYLGEHAPGFVERQGPELQEAIRMVTSCGGIASLAHPVRVKSAAGNLERPFFRLMADWGLTAVEASHSDHTREDVTRYLGLAEDYGLAVTGGSDFHGTVKPGVRLGGATLSRVHLDRLRALGGSGGL